MTAPAVVGTPTIQNVNNFNLAAFTVPPGLQNHDDLVMVIQNQDSATTLDYTNDAGMVRVGVPFATANTTTRVFGIWRLPVPVASSAPSTITFTRPGASAGTRAVGMLFIIRGTGTGPLVVDAASTTFNNTGTTTATASALTSGGADRLAIAAFGSNWVSPNDSTVSSGPSGMTQVGLRQEPDPGTSSVSRTQLAVYSQAVGAGSTGDKVLTWAGTSAQRGGQMVLWANPAASNLAPTANAGPDQNAATGALITLTSAGSSDPEGGGLTYDWLQTAGTPVTLIGGATHVSPQIITPSTPQTLTFRLIVTDPAGNASAPDSVNIVVLPDVSYVSQGPVGSMATGATWADFPTTHAAGDRLTMVAFVNTASVPTHNHPGYGSPVGPPTMVGNGIYATVWTKVSAGTEVGHVTVTATGATKGVAYQIAYRGVTTPYLQVLFGADNDTSSSTISAASASIWQTQPGDIIAATFMVTTSTGTYTDANIATPHLVSSGSGVFAPPVQRFTATADGATSIYNLSEGRVITGGVGSPSTSGFTTNGTAAGVAVFLKFSLSDTPPPPVANAGPDQNVQPWVTVQLDGRGSSGQTSQDWTQIAGPVVGLSDPTGLQPEFEAPCEIGGTTLTFSLGVSNGVGGTASDNVSIFVASGTRFYKNSLGQWKGCRTEAL